MPLPRRYSWALRRSVRSGSWLPSSIVASTMGRSPEMPYFHSSGCPRRFSSTASGDRRRGSPNSSRPASRWNRIVSSTVSPRCRNSICACVLASAIARATARRSWYFSMRRRAPASLSANAVVNDSRAVPPGGRRIDWRRLTIGSSTAPVVFDSGPPPPSAAGLASVRPRPMNRARSVSYSVAPPMRPRPLSTWTR